jgi:hypothetical protein
VEEKSRKFSGSFFAGELDSNYKEARFAFDLEPKEKREADKRRKKSGGGERT